MSERTHGLARWVDRLLHVGDTPQRTAAAFAVGVFFGFSPLLGLHAALGLACAFVLRLNRVAVLLGVFANVPWILPPYYALATAAGAVLLGTDGPANFAAGLRAALDEPLMGARIGRLVSLVRPFLWSYVVGSTAGAIVLALIAYRIALTLLAARRGPFARGASGVAG